jgi:hypothetical protein
MVGHLRLMAKLSFVRKSLTTIFLFCSSLTGRSIMKRILTPYVVHFCLGRIQGEGF